MTKTEHILPSNPRLLEREGGATFTFATDGIEAALEQARRAADGRARRGAKAAQQYFAAGFLDDRAPADAPRVNTVTLSHSLTLRLRAA